VTVVVKGWKERIVYLGRSAHEALLTYRTFVRLNYIKKPAEQNIFLSRTGWELAVSAIDIMIQKVAKAAGVQRLHPHLLRHTAATQYLVHGGDVISLQRKLGHSGLEMTSRYVHLAVDQAAAIDQQVAPMDKIDIKQTRVPRAGWPMCCVCLKTPAWPWLAGTCISRLTGRLLSSSKRALFLNWSQGEIAERIWYRVSGTWQQKVMAMSNVGKWASTWTNRYISTLRAV
jgi:hypothetical protein